MQARSPALGSVGKQESRDRLTSEIYTSHRDSEVTEARAHRDMPPSSYIWHDMNSFDIRLTTKSSRRDVEMRLPAKVGLWTLCVRGRARASGACSDDQVPTTRGRATRGQERRCGCRARVVNFQLGSHSHCVLAADLVVWLRKPTTKHSALNSHIVTTR
jgi:hypothetical protein